MELMKGVYQVKVPMPLGPGLDHINVYLLEGTNGNLLIDAGWNTPEAFTALKQELLVDGFQIKDISHIAITHLHPDHYGLAGRIKEISGAKILMSEVESSMLEQRYMDVSSLLDSVTEFLGASGIPKDDLPQFSKASMPVLDFVVPVKPDEMLNAESTIEMEPFKLKVIMTPGHSPGHICFYEPNRKYLFAGDHILSDISPHIGLHPQSGENPLSDYLNSLQAMKELEVKFVFPGHGGVFSGLNQKIEALMGHHQEREWEIMKLISKGPKTAYQIAQEIPWMPGGEPIGFIKLATLDKRLAVLETLAHLQYLISQGKVTKDSRDQVNYYESLVMP
jgi:glyoxylase-like metal-dependent hydrolase (beta-lactamase superfamily II)